MSLSAAFTENVITPKKSGRLWPAGDAEVRVRGDTWSCTPSREVSTAGGLTISAAVSENAGLMQVDTAPLQNPTFTDAVSTSRWVAYIDRALLRGIKVLLGFLSGL